MDRSELNTQEKLIAGFGAEICRIVRTAQPLKSRLYHRCPKCGLLVYHILPHILSNCEFDRNGLKDRPDGI